jgi:pimeloyl-ACP methyl ester carboxylesterase
MTAHSLDVQDMTPRRIATRLGSIYCVAGGAGTPLLILHSTPNSHTHFAPLLPLLMPFYRVIAPDTLGFGQSDPMPPTITMEALAETMTAVLDAFGIARAHVYGFHTGNKIAAALAAGHSGRVDRVILAGQTHSLIDDKIARDAAIAPFAAKFLSKDPPADPAAAQLWHSAGPIYRANFAFDLGAAVRRISAPTLLLEFATPAEDHFGHQAPALAKAMPAGQALVLENTGAQVHQQSPERISAIVRDFFR